MTETCPLGPFSKLGHESEFTSLATGKLPTHQYQTHTYANVATLNLVRGRKGGREEEGKGREQGVAFRLNSYSKFSMLKLILASFKLC